MATLTRQFEGRSLMDLQSLKEKSTNERDLERRRTSGVERKKSEERVQICIKQGKGSSCCPEKYGNIS